MRFILASIFFAINISADELKLDDSSVCNAVITKRLQSNQDAYQQALNKIINVKK